MGRLGTSKGRPYSDDRRKRLAVIEMVLRLRPSASGAEIAREFNRQLNELHTFLSLRTLENEVSLVRRRLGREAAKRRACDSMPITLTPGMLMVSRAIAEAPQGRSARARPI
jgi:hypothetical protein